MRGGRCEAAPPGGRPVDGSVRRDAARLPAGRAADLTTESRERNPDIAMPRLPENMGISVPLRELSREAQRDWPMPPALKDANRQLRSGRPMTREQAMGLRARVRENAHHRDHGCNPIGTGRSRQAMPRGPCNHALRHAMADSKQPCGSQTGPLRAASEESPSSVSMTRRSPDPLRLRRTNALASANARP